MKFKHALCITVLSALLPLSTQTHAAVMSDSDTLRWAGCGITKKAFMAELAKAYEKKTGIKITLKGGGATKGIRNASKGAIHIGGACRASIESHPEERSAYQVPVAWDALVVITNKKNPVDNITFEQLKGLF